MENSVTGVINLLAMVAPESAEEMQKTRRMINLKSAASDTLEKLLVPPPLVLVVDDDAEYRGLLLMYLERSKRCRAVAVPTAAQALVVLDRDPVQLVVTDLHMAVMDGVTLLRVVRRRWPGVVRVLMSGSHASSAPKSKLMRLFVRKQTSLMEMTDLLMALLPE